LLHPARVDIDEGAIAANLAVARDSRAMRMPGSSAGGERVAIRELTDAVRVPVTELLPRLVRMLPQIAHV
jgi:hypothetical protein